MNKNIKSSKDIWDKIDILSKIVSGIVLVLIAIVLKFGADKISSSLQTGQLVQSLIADLSSPDTTKIRQEIALVALDQVLWNQNPELVLKVCERIVLNTDQYDQITGVLAFEILKSRAPIRADALFEEIKNDEVGVPITKPTTSYDDTAAVIQYTTNIIVENPKLLNRVKKNKLYMHFANEKNREKIRELHREFIEVGFNAPGIQRVEGNYNVDIRFFHEEDSILTGSVAQIIKNFLEKEGINIESVPIKNFSRTAYQNLATVGLIEVWINLVRLKEQKEEH